MNRILLIAGILFGIVLSTGLAFASVPATEPVAAATAADHAPDAAHGGHGDADLNPLDWRSDVALWTLVVFVLLVTVLGKYAFKPIAQALDAREQAVHDQISSAQQANNEAKDILKQYQQKLAESKDEVRQILDTARKDAQRVADGIVEKAKEAAQLENSRAVKEIESATINALQNIAEKSATLATHLAGKMIRAEVKPENHRDLINGALEEFTKN